MNTIHETQPNAPTNSHLNVDILDVVFEGRNKSYGAYDLRRTYPNRVKHAMFAAIFAVTGLLIIPFISMALHANDKKGIDDIKITDCGPKPPPPEPEKPIIPPPPPIVDVTPPPQVETIRFLPPVPVPDKLAET